jgi:hypothetical protein
MSETNITYGAFLLSYCLREDSMISDVARSTPYPHVQYFGDSDVFGSMTTFRVHAEGVEVTNCSDAATAMTICFLAYWIFDIKYAKLFSGTLSFLDNYIFKKNSVPISQKVLTLINKF